MTDADRDDIKAMRKDGSLRDFLRCQIADGRRRRQPAAPVPAPRPPGHTPGAWPTGSRPPSRIADVPPGAWDAALERARNDSQQGTTCECGGCLTPSQED
ncbi:hypothetical protein [Streptomyces sp. ISL-94]|uniref:hypothetical protein n=1 Tax=Streptomyces sp. ISL-94 TaxID=2819190 RepID=UPI001BEBB619|nr:hypothetical protein [Streptomyces sp. ISL-94]MBT2477602.1 hypothetical protein [Streptomyces sp. ISL-94]